MYTYNTYTMTRTHTHTHTHTHTYTHTHTHTHTHIYIYTHTYTHTHTHTHTHTYIYIYTHTYTRARTHTHTHTHTNTHTHTHVIGYSKLSYTFQPIILTHVHMNTFYRPLVSYRGEDAGEMFVRKLQKEAEPLFQEYIATPQQLLALTEAELRSFHTAINCHICNQPLGMDKVRDHSDIVGKYRDTTHSGCNLA